MSPQVRAAIDRIIAERAGIGRVPLFPAPNDPSRALAGPLADRWLMKAERVAGLAPLPCGRWHPFRRKWATERKHLPAPDVAAAGGWKELTSLQRCYQHSDAATMLRVVLEPGELREVKG